jgi:hypothetical protein
MLCADDLHCMQHRVSRLNSCVNLLAMGDGQKWTRAGSALGGQVPEQRAWLPFQIRRTETTRREHSKPSPLTGRRIFDFVGTSGLDSSLSTSSPERAARQGPTSNFRVSTGSVSTKAFCSQCDEGGTSNLVSLLSGSWSAVCSQHC